MPHRFNVPRSSADADNVSVERRIGELTQLLRECLLIDRLRLGARLAARLARRTSAGLAGDFDDLLKSAGASAALRARRMESRPDVRFPVELPISARADEICQAIRTNRVVVVSGETGSGKTTQLPKICLEAGAGVEGRIGCTQPRRLAALSISKRVAEELGVGWGREVGSKIRFSDQTDPLTLIKFMTDGILLAELQGDPNLAEYDALIIDEAHERSLNIDFLLGHLTRLLRKRDDLKLVITSATIDTAAFSQAFDGAPVIEVSGRMFPVEVRHAPPDGQGEADQRDEVTYIDAAVSAVQGVLSESIDGDVLVFMPAERDIRETCDRLDGRVAGEAEVVPLFGRLTSGDQQRVFQPGGRRRIVVATNIAETSLTIPRIRYVVDSGLARISRYSPRTRTRRLPIEAVAQSSANQRKGRAGRVGPGVCIRLYSEEDFDQRPPFSQPEIQRSNLAEVILRMKAWQLGEIESFPFINPPSPAAIRSGYGLLQELGALDGARDLTPLGRDLARLPVDPTLGRMVLQARAEGAVDEVLVIASGLSIQDPRERPLDQQAAADQAHQQFKNPESDFLTLLNIWGAFHDEFESLRTQSQMRKFCRRHFLSYTRMREWRDLHAQIGDSLREVGPARRPAEPADAAAVHRSVLSGLISHIARRKERNVYVGTGNRFVSMFPGSVLFDRSPPGKKGKRNQGDSADAERAKVNQPEWIVAGEWVETSRLFVRTVARIDPKWVVELGLHLCKRDYVEPRWDPKKARVLVTERFSLGGLLLDSATVDFGKVDPVAATELFIRGALIDPGDPSFVYPFLEHNRRLRGRIEAWQTRLRHHQLHDLDEAFFGFYRSRLESVSSIHDLNRLVGERGRGNDQFLFANEADIVGDQGIEFDSSAFPERIVAGDAALEVQYNYAPGESEDGVTIRVPIGLAPVVPQGALDWCVPGLRREQVMALLRALPKSCRRQLMPLADKADEIVRHLNPGDKTLPAALREFVTGRYGIQLPSDTWEGDVLPAHLKPRFEVIGKNEKTVLAGRDLRDLARQMEQQEPARPDLGAWNRAVDRWERFGLTRWDFGDLPEHIELGDSAGIPLRAFPGLTVEQGEVGVRLFRRRDEAETESRVAVPKLASVVLSRELAWLVRDLQGLRAMGDRIVTLTSIDAFEESALAHLEAYLFEMESALPLTQSRFNALLEQAAARIRGLVPRFLDEISNIIQLRQQVLLCPRPYPGMIADLDRLIPQDFLRSIEYPRLQHLSRYLKAMRVRADRASANPAKDLEKANLIAPYQQALNKLASEVEMNPRKRSLWTTLRWMLEEYRVSCFAQELGTAQKVSPRRMDDLIRAFRATA